MREPTEKQIRFAQAISETLNISMPKLMTRQSLYCFIRDNKPEYEEHKHFYKDDDETEVDTFIDGTNIVDFFYGDICSWGDS